MTVGIYSITNIVNNKRYIGQSINIEKRWQDHKRKLKLKQHKNSHLQNAYNKYGPNNFIYNIIEKCKKKELNSKEIFYIKKYNSYNNGYNMSLGGEYSPSCNPEVKEKLRQYNLNKTLSTNTRKKISQAIKKKNYIKLKTNFLLYDSINLLSIIEKGILLGYNKNEIFTYLSTKYSTPYIHLELYMQKKNITWDMFYYYVHNNYIKQHEQEIILLFYNGYTQINIAKKMSLNKKIFNSFCTENHYRTKVSYKKVSYKHNRKTRIIPNTTGYYRVDKQPGKRYKNGYIYRYTYKDANNKIKTLKSTDLKKLEKKVKNNNLLWKKVPIKS